MSWSRCCVAAWFMMATWNCCGSAGFPERNKLQCVCEAWKWVEQVSHLFKQVSAVIVLGNVRIALLNKESHRSSVNRDTLGGTIVMALSVTFTYHR